MKTKEKMFGYKVKINSTRDHYQHDGEQWGSWEASSSHVLESIVEKTEEYPDIVSCLDIPSGTHAIVVWVIWSSGNSFGHESGAYSECIGIFQDLNAAKELKGYIEKKTKDFNFTTSDDQTFKLEYIPWDGYFESLDSVEISVVSVF